MRTNWMHLLASAFVIAGCAADRVNSDGSPAPDLNAPAAPREFRAAWVATVQNIDWPSKPGLSTDQQQKEIIAILDCAKDLNLNAIVLQVRPSCDAMYPSRLEPWAEYLTGTQGQKPDPYYDPLKMWIDQAHQRGIELHAWFNPYRARHHQAKSANAPSHQANRKPAIVKEYGGYLWLDPGEDDAAEHSLKVFLDVVKRYDIDGVHIDDYFYPYPVKAPTTAPASTQSASTQPAPEVDFPDEPSWQKYVKSGGKMSRADWRRDNINRFIEKLHHGIRRQRQHVKIGISPFGLGRPDRRPPGIEGFSQYDKLYADAEKWLESGWCDYWTPQLYWPIEQKKQAFPVLLEYWRQQNRMDRHLWPGMFTSRIDDSPKSWMPDEIVNQIRITRDELKVNPGHVHFSMKALLENRRGICDALKSGPYNQPALVPASTWLDSTPPPTPTVRARRVGDGAVEVRISPGWGERAFLWAVWIRHSDMWRFRVLPATTRQLELPRQPSGLEVVGVVVSAVDRCGNESARATAVPR